MNPSEAGQISPETPFGSALRHIAADQRFKKFLEVGTYHGVGSTLCILLGFAGRQDTPSLWTVEADKQLMMMAQHRWRDFSNQMAVGRVRPTSWYLPLAKAVEEQKGKFSPAWVKFFHGRIADRIMTKAEVMVHPLFNSVLQHFLLFFPKECRDFEECPYLGLTAEMDVVVLDGGEFSGYYDYLAARRANPKIIALDDTHVLKGSRAKEELLREGWRCVAEGADRNGWGIYSRPDVELEPVGGC